MAGSLWITATVPGVERGVLLRGDNLAGPVASITAKAGPAFYGDVELSTVTDSNGEVELLATAWNIVGADTVSVRTVPQAGGVAQFVMNVSP